jgi:Leucine-rich repeat (LRR) protein
MTIKIMKKKLPILLLLIAVLVCIATLFLDYWPNNAFPAEKQAAKKIEQAAYGPNNKFYEFSSAYDYCNRVDWYTGLPRCTLFTEIFNPRFAYCYGGSSAWCDSGHVTTLYLAGAQLQKVPPGIADLPGLKHLHLSNNRLTSLPPEIREIHNLTFLDISNNQLTSLPSEIHEIHTLTNLILSNNQLTGLPPEIGELRTLTHLTLSNNQLTNLPPEIGELRSLLYLNLSGNRLTSLPPEIGSLANLRYLDVSGNPLSGPLPDYLINLPITYEGFKFSETDYCIPADDEIHSWLEIVSSSYYVTQHLYIDRVCPK